MKIINKNPTFKKPSFEKQIDDAMKNPGVEEISEFYINIKEQTKEKKKKSKRSK